MNNCSISMVRDIFILLLYKEIVVGLNCFCFVFVRILVKFFNFVIKL